VRFVRASGILLHPTSVPGQFGIGDLGEQAFAFVDFLEDAGQSIWQVLPLGPTGYGDSPYQSFSAFAGNPLLISLDNLRCDGLLSRADLERNPAQVVSGDRIDYGAVIAHKNSLLEIAYQNFKSSAMNSEFEEFTRASAEWLDGYALFRALKEEHRGAPWLKWDRPIARHERDAVSAARRRLDDRIQAHKFFQWLFFRQWRALKSYANDKGVKVLGDMPIFVALDSADVWERAELFKLDSDRRPLVVAGVPPDYFSETGQLWGNPLYDWERMRENGFEWWISRVKTALSVFDIIRLDHFRGFAACWEVPAADETAERGEWVEVPGRALFETLRARLGELPLMAEDLGVITPDVIELRDRFEFPGMRILQFAFGADARNRDLPHNYVQNSVAYTGTHDNDTTLGWFHSKPGKGSTRTRAQVLREREFCLKYLNSNGREIHWDFIRAVHASVSDTAIVPMQDVLGLDSSARMNLPASNHGNWGWRASAADFSASLASRLRDLTELYGRCHQRSAPSQEHEDHNIEN
jgi:4-alpha-glucanotransferase